jgi:ADP-ribose pyrophosphatase YjhB (NUDIX family)
MRDWRLEVNGKQVQSVETASFKHAGIGIELNYGMRPEGYDGIVVTDPGGVVIMPYVIDDSGKIYVGVIQEIRSTMGPNALWSVPRGFCDLGETMVQAAARELGEETGYKVSAERMVCLIEGLNPNSSFFDYSQSEQAGVSVYATRIAINELELSRDKDDEIFYVFPQAIRSQAQGDEPAERILGSRFITIKRALQSRDMFTSAAVGLLLGYL